MKRKYKILGSMAAITCMTSAVAISVTNCSCGGSTSIGDFVWTGSINKHWVSYQDLANTQFVTVQSTPVDYTQGGVMTDPTNPAMIKSISQVFGTTGTTAQMQQTLCDAFMQSIVSQLSQGYAIADYKFDPQYPNEDVSKYNENWKKYFEANCTAASQVDYKISFDFTPGNGLAPAILNNYHERFTFAGFEFYDGEWHEFSGIIDRIQITPNAPLYSAYNDWDGITNEDGMVNVLKLYFGSETTDYFHELMYDAIDGTIYEDETVTDVDLSFYEFFPTFYGSIFPLPR